MEKEETTEKPKESQDALEEEILLTQRVIEIADSQQEM